MRFTIRCRNKGSRATWNEEYDYPHIQTQEQAEAWARSTIQTFNTELRPGEVEREFIEATMGGPSLVHNWEKSNLVTIISDDRFERPYDTYRCKACGATGKRYGLDPHVTTDSGVPSACPNYQT